VLVTASTLLASSLCRPHFGIFFLSAATSSRSVSIFLFIDCQLFDCVQPALLKSADLLRQAAFLLLQLPICSFRPLISRPFTTPLIHHTTPRRGSKAG
jgi:hypothetical protein